MTKSVVRKLKCPCFNSELAGFLPKIPKPNTCMRKDCELGGVGVARSAHAMSGHGSGP